MSDADRALAIALNRLNAEADAAMRNPHRPSCPVTVLRAYIRNDFNDAGLTDYARALDVAISAANGNAVR